MNFSEDDGKGNMNIYVFDLINHLDLVDLKVERNMPIICRYSNDKQMHWSVRKEEGKLLVKVTTRLKRWRI